LEALDPVVLLPAILSTREKRQLRIWYACSCEADVDEST
jgi:hypothetical protein